MTSIVTNTTPDNVVTVHVIVEAPDLVYSSAPNHRTDSALHDVIKQMGAVIMAIAPGLYKDEVAGTSYDD